METDAGTFQRLVADGGEASLRAALDLYRGTLLERFEVVAPAFEEWLSGERARFHELAVGVLRRLLEHERRQGAADGVIVTAHQLLTLEPWHEDAHRALMRAYAEQGRRAAALRQYQSCVEILRRELQSEPGTDPRALPRVAAAPAAAPDPRYWNAPSPVGSFDRARPAPDRARRGA